MKPSIEQSSSEELDQPITIEELFAAVSSLQSRLNFIKCSGKNSPLYCWICSTNHSKKAIPKPSIRLLFLFSWKKEKVPVDCTSFHPISLLNVDFKLLSKTLALRLERVLPTIISLDQTGFIQNRHLFSNLGQLFNIIYSPSQVNIKEALISMDAEKNVWSSWMGLFILYSG